LGRASATPGVDPSLVNTAAELAACLDGLRRRRGLSYEAMEQASRKLRPRAGEPPLEVLGKSTVGEIVNGKRPPSKEKLRTYLAVCRVSGADFAQWVAAWERARTADLASPAGAVRVRAASPRRLGVHAAIHVNGEISDLPAYVPRDVDPQLRSALAAGAEHGCFVLLVGGSSVGKTRTLWEGVQTAFPDWWLLHPAGSEDVRSLAAAPKARTVVWLDELQRYLGGENGLSAGTVRELLRGGFILVGTMWPNEYASRISLRRRGGDDHGGERELLQLAQVMDVPPAFSEAERHRAQHVASNDRRIRQALNNEDAGITQVLAAGPELVRWWEHGANPYGCAAITASVDARRLGVHAPLTRQLLAGAIPGYLTAEQRATPPHDWLSAALAYATTPLHGAASALRPVDDGTMGGISGYVAADYLLQHGRRTRRVVCPPASAWQALADHLDDFDALQDVASSADARMLYRYSRPIYEILASFDELDPAIRVRVQEGDIDGAISYVRELHLDGDSEATDCLIWILDELGYVDAAAAQIRSRSSWVSAAGLVSLYSRHGRFDELRQLADAGDQYAARRLAFQLARRGRPLEALALVRPQAEAVPPNEWAATWMCECLALLDQLDELQARADAGDEYAELRLLARRGCLDEIRSRVIAGDESAELFILTALLDLGQIDDAAAELRRQIEEDVENGGDIDPADQLAELLATHDRLDELRLEVFAGNPYAGRWLIHLLTEQGHVEQAEMLQRVGLNPDGTIASPAGT